MAEMSLELAGIDRVYFPIAGAVIEFTVKRDKGAADMLEIKIAGTKPEPFPSFIRLYVGGRLLFDGVVDDMISCRQGNYSYTEFVARDMLSLLMDNQLRPCTLRDPSLRLFNERYLQPLGFTARGDMSAFRGELKISEGTGIMKGLREFCMKFMGAEPEVNGKGIYCGIEAPFRQIKADLPETARELTVSRYGMASEMFVKNSLSSVYSARKVNPVDMGFRRVVYGDGDFNESRRLQLSLAGLADVRPGDVYGGELKAESVKLSFSSHEFTTRIGGSLCG